MNINDEEGEEQPSKHALVSGQESVFSLVCVFACVSNRWGREEGKGVNVLIFSNLCVCFMYLLQRHRWDKDLFMLCGPISVPTALLCWKCSHIGSCIILSYF